MVTAASTTMQSISSSSCILLLYFPWYWSFSVVHALAASGHVFMRTESTHLRTIPDDALLIPFSSGEQALQGAGMAKNVRKLRTSRGRVPVERKVAHESLSKLPIVGINSATTSKSPSRNISVMKHNKYVHLSYASALQVLRMYHEKHNDLAIPRRFLVPHDPSYPQEWHGIDLPGTVYNMKWWQSHVRHHPDRVAELNALGFIWERLQPEWNLILEALITYSSIHGNLLVPVSFVVPHGDSDFPIATWGLSLGKCVHRMRIRHDFLKGQKGATRRSQLNQLRFVWDVNEFVFEKFFAALVHYAKLEQQQKKLQEQHHQQQHRHMANGDADLFEKYLKIPTSFCVPSDPSWPQGLWGYPLGAKCTAVRQKGLYVKGNVERQARLEAIGFSWKGNASRGWYQVVHAAAIYSQILQANNNNNRNNNQQLSPRVLDVPCDYRVPRPPEIMSAGFYVGSNEEAWPWPETLWDFPLGQRLKDIRLKGAYLNEKDGPKRRAQLDALGFVWNPPRGRRKSG